MVNAASTHAPIAQQRQRRAFGSATGFSARRRRAAPRAAPAAQGLWICDKEFVPPTGTDAKGATAAQSPEIWGPAGFLYGRSAIRNAATATAARSLWICDKTPHVDGKVRDNAATAARSREICDPWEEARGIASFSIAAMAARSLWICDGAPVEIEGVLCLAATAARSPEICDHDFALIWDEDHEQQRQRSAGP
jgi:hypothetical protein